MSVVAEIGPVQSSRPHDKGKSGHVAALDGIRGLAILLVMLLHTFWMFNLTDRPSSIIDRGYQGIIRMGWIGVDLFFVLSGFLITGILYSSREKRRYFVNFYGRRVLRIFPLYYCFLFLVVFAIPLGRHLVGRHAADIKPTWSYWFFLSNFVIARHTAFARGNMLDISWSLAIEEQFYIVWPLLVWLLHRRTMMWICAAIVVLGPVLRALLAARGSPPQAIFMLTPTRLDGLAMGAWVALAMAGPMSASLLRRLCAAAALLALAGLAALLVVYGQLSIDDRGMEVFGYSALALLFAALVAAVTLPSAVPWLAKFFSSRFLTFFGRYSYGLYLLHLPVLGFVRDGLFNHWTHRIWLGQQWPCLVAFQIVVIGISVLVALASWNLIEKRFLTLKRYFAS